MWSGNELFHKTEEFNFCFKKDQLRAIFKVRFLAPAFDSSYMAIVNASNHESISEFLVHFDQKDKNIWRLLPDKLCESNHIQVLSSCKILLLSPKHNTVKIYCLRTGKETEIQHKINELTNEITIHTFSETRMFCVEENIRHYIYLTYYPFDESCPFDQ